MAGTAGITCIEGSITALDHWLFIATQDQVIEMHGFPARHQNKNVGTSMQTTNTLNQYVFYL